jgi:UDP-N-acetylmuramate dehydrogenase
MSIEHSFKKNLGYIFSERVFFDEPMRSHVAYGIGGNADALVFPISIQELEMLRKIAGRSIPITVIGSGTNLLVRDEGIRGITVMVGEAFSKIEIARSDAGRVWVRCGGGAKKETFLNWCAERGFGGLEFSTGIPGTVGGGIFMNAGTKYGCYAGVLEELVLWNWERGAVTLTGKGLNFGYRTQKSVRENALVLSAVFVLSSGDPKSIIDEIQRIFAERAAKQPLELPSCGSTFKNPEGHSAGRLIERCGLKGLRVGGAEISQKHANFILNKENATASDILTLIDISAHAVKSRFGIELEPEVRVVGGP